MTETPPPSDLILPAPIDHTAWGEANGATWCGKFYPTDKIQNGFVPVYEKLLAPLRERPVRMLEIGVAAGGSSLLWSDFFRHPDARIIGIDLKVPSIEVDPNRVIFEVCDQNDRARLRDLAERFGPFDIVIEDGCHRYTESRVCYEELFAYVKPGGVYIIEDWFVGYVKEYARSFSGAKGQTMVTLVRDIVREGRRAGIRSSEVIVNPCSLAAFWKASSGLTAPAVSLRAVRADGKPLEFATATALGRWLFGVLLLPYAPWLLQFANLLNNIRPRGRSRND